MMTKRKLIYIVATAITSVLFLVATIVFFVNKNPAEYYTIQYDVYKNVNQLQNLREEIVEELSIDFNRAFLRNSSEIRTDKDGNITYLNIEAYIIRDSDCFAIQIQGNDESDYTIIQEKSEGIRGERISLDIVLGAISVWKFETDEQEIKFIFGRELLNGVKKNTTTEQYLFSENSILNLQTDLEGLFGRIIVIQEMEHQEYYFKVK